MAKQYNPSDQTVVYDGPKKVWREGNLVFKKDPDRLGQQWRGQMEKILEVLDSSSLERFLLRTAMPPVM